MSLILALITAALILVFFEVILPGGILGILAVVCVILATWIAGAQSGVGAAALTFFGASAAIAVLVYIEFKVLARTSLGGAFFLKNTVTGHSNQAPAAPTIVGQQGTALTRLNPSGKVAIGGQTYEAYSQDGYIEVDSPIKVASRDSFKLIIKKL